VVPARQAALRRHRDALRRRGVCSPPHRWSKFELLMSNANQELVCDGCGQPASLEHIARRLQRLEGATRYRPIHINTVLLGAAPPMRDAEYFYSTECQFSGEAKLLAEVAGLTALDRPTEQLHAAFQRVGFFAIHVLECPFGGGAGKSLTDLLATRLPVAITRIRRSLRPKRVALVSSLLDPFVSQLGTELAGCKVTANAGKAFALDQADAESVATLLRAALAEAA
jgi:hypothetical protein